MYCDNIKIHFRWNRFQSKQFRVIGRIKQDEEIQTPLMTDTSEKEIPGVCKMDPETWLVVTLSPDS